MPFSYKMQEVSPQLINSTFYFNSLFQLKSHDWGSRLAYKVVLGSIVSRTMILTVQILITCGDLWGCLAHYPYPGRKCNCLASSA